MDLRDGLPHFGSDGDMQTGHRKGELDVADVQVNGIVALIWVPLLSAVRPAAPYGPRMKRKSMIVRRTETQEWLFSDRSLAATP
jgi:hypothetical protein